MVPIHTPGSCDKDSNTSESVRWRQLISISKAVCNNSQGKKTAPSPQLLSYWNFCIRGSYWSMCGCSSGMVSPHPGCSHMVIGLLQIQMLTFHSSLFLQSEVALKTDLSANGLAADCPCRLAHIATIFVSIPSSLATAGHRQDLNSCNNSCRFGCGFVCRAGLSYLRGLFLP